MIISRKIELDARSEKLIPLLASSTLLIPMYARMTAAAYSTNIVNSSVQMCITHKKRETIHTVM